MSRLRITSLTTECHVTAYLLRFVKLLKSKIKSDASIEPTTRAVEMSEAETLWIIESQLMLTRDRNFDNWKKQFGLFLDTTGIWRCGGRLSNADIPFSTKHPILHYTRITT